MRNHNSRIRKLETALQNFEHENDICCIFIAQRGDITDTEIIGSLKKDHGIELTTEQFSRWRKEKHKNRLIIMSPNFHIDKVLLKRRLDSQRKHSLEVGKQYEKP